MINNLSSELAARRSHWLTELEAALAQASKLTLAMFDQNSDGQEAILIHAQIVALRRKIGSIEPPR